MTADGLCEKAISKDAKDMESMHMYKTRNAISLKLERIDVGLYVSSDW